MNIGTQYKPDDAFKAEARLHQSKYRAEVLGGDFQDYGNRLCDADYEIDTSAPFGIDIMLQMDDIVRQM